ncbi:hypothetical protein QBL02_04835 [Leucobacter sp. UT-8R-CII-1-4]|uniref:hypothetical protein n=1 Tax=Leucobacter sp. UT-8R-CII-1-4 TaxID=3040075 RepID=UPI0024A93CE2|nr:hypothetical protein [Leucobacter sp. UT-8R-CII-1-4]MDI6022865.1 hypothetical protein [Leucobacter sp. UT-8R-CII-1-4]
MQYAASLAFAVLSPVQVSDEQFFVATALLATRFDVRSEHGDLRSDDQALEVLERWYLHANARPPDLAVWQLSCQIHRFFESDHGRVLPLHWPWNAREQILALNERLRTNPKWCELLQRAVATPESGALSSIACCAAARVGEDPWPVCWQYLGEHVDDGNAWGVVAGFITEPRLGGYLALARRTLLLEPVPNFAATRRDDSRQRMLRRPHPLCQVWREVLRLLARFPGHGIDLIECALFSPETELRLQAAELLLIFWRGRPLPPDTITFLRERSLLEVDPSVQEVMRMNLIRA